jgi:hypothetical protein
MITPVSMGNNLTKELMRLFFSCQKSWWLNDLNFSAKLNEIVGITENKKHHSKYNIN